MKRPLPLIIALVLLSVAVSVPVSAQEPTSTPTPAPTSIPTPVPFVPCAESTPLPDTTSTPTPSPDATPEPTSSPSATPSPIACAHLIAKPKPSDGILADWYIDGALVGLQLPTLDVQVVANKSHKIEARNVTDPAANGVYEWKNATNFAYLQPAAEKTVTLYLVKKYLKGFLKLKCVVANLQPEDVASCLPSVDDVPGEAIAPGATVTINLPPGKHSVVVGLAPEGAWYAALFKRTIYIYAGASTYVTSVFTPLRAIPPLAGHGQVVTDKIDVQFAASRVRFTHDGSSNFIVWVYDQNNDRDLLVNEIGHFTGAVPLYKPGTYFFEISADGNWTMKIEPLVQNDALASGIDGTGDYVSDWFAPTTTGYVPYHFTHNGNSNFIVWLACGHSRDLLQNEIGPVDNQAVVYFSGASCFWVVDADGDWSIHPK